MSNTLAFLCLAALSSQLAMGALMKDSKCKCTGGVTASAVTAMLNGQVTGNVNDCTGNLCTFVADAAANKENVCYTYAMKVGNPLTGCATVDKPAERGDEWKSAGKTSVPLTKMFFCDTAECNIQTYESGNGAAAASSVAGLLVAALLAIALH